MKYSKYDLDILYEVIEILRSLPPEGLAGQLAYHEDALARTQSPRDREVIEENIRIIREIMAERN